MRALLRQFGVSLGWFLGIAAGGLVLLVVVVGSVLLTTRPPPPESEVRAFMSVHGVEDAVSVDDCRPVQGDSTFDFYRCDLRVDGLARVESGDGTVASFSTGTYCFDIPRSGWREDGAAKFQPFGC